MPPHSSRADWTEGWSSDSQSVTNAHRPPAAATARHSALQTRGRKNLNSQLTTVSFRVPALYQGFPYLWSQLIYGFMIIFFICCTIKKVTCDVKVTRYFIVRKKNLFSRQLFGDDYGNTVTNFICRRKGAHRLGFSFCCFSFPEKFDKIISKKYISIPTSKNSLISSSLTTFLLLANLDRYSMRLSFMLL